MGSVNEETKLERLTRRDKAIIKRYEALRKKTVHGAKLYTHDGILAMVAHEFYLSRNSINNIINGYNNYQKQKGYQGNLFE